MFKRNEKINDINYKIQFIYKIYFHIIDNNKKIANLRNQLLLHRHGKLPSYCLFSSLDIAKETPTEKFMWFMDFC